MTIKAQYELIEIANIRKGDQFVDRATGRLIWTAESDAIKLATDGIRIDIRYVDGGQADRRWTPLSAAMLLPIVRTDAPVRT